MNVQHETKDTNICNCNEKHLKCILGSQVPGNIWKQNLDRYRMLIISNLCYMQLSPSHYVSFKVAVMFENVI